MVPSHSTLLAITVFTPALAGCLLLLSWLQHRNITALALWGSGFITASVATTLIVIARGTIPDFWSIIVGNALLAAAYGILWCGARKFEGQEVSILPALAGVVLWIVACSIRPYLCAGGSPGHRDGGDWHLLYAACHRLNSGADAVTAHGVGRLCCCSSAMLPPFRSKSPLLAPGHPILADVDLLTFTIFETAFVCICAAYLFGGLAKDRIAASYRHASLTDPLTGVPNRRSFLQTGERLLIRARFARQPAALLMFDLDRFKSINDRYGHHTGDEVLDRILSVRYVTAAAERPFWPDRR